jgi:hypothetical protein
MQLILMGGGKIRRPHLEKRFNEKRRHSFLAAKERESPEGISPRLKTIRQRW